MSGVMSLRVCHSTPLSHLYCKHTNPSFSLLLKLGVSEKAGELGVLAYVVDRFLFGVSWRCLQLLSLFSMKRCYQRDLIWESFPVFVILASARGKPRPA